LCSFKGAIYYRPILPFENIGKEKDIRQRWVVFEDGIPSF
jgi:hypothetical protein